MHFFLDKFFIEEALLALMFFLLWVHLFLPPGSFKKLITDVLVETLEPIQKRHKELMSDRAYLNEVLLDGE